MLALVIASQPMTMTAVSGDQFWLAIAHVGTTGLLGTMLGCAALWAVHRASGA